jgi:hypothetical protein
MSIFSYKHNKDSIKQKILNIKTDIEKIMSDNCSEKYDVIWYGAYYIDPKHLVYWICIETDKVKKELEANTELNIQLRNLLEKHQYPAQSQKFVYIGFESQETVDRESKGNWYHHFK